jgi:hypothetical protein
MTGEPDECDGPRLTHERQIAELKEDLAHHVRWRERHTRPADADEIRWRVRNRLTSGNPLRLIILAAFACFLTPIAFGWPQVAPFILLVASAGLVYGAGLLFESRFAPQSHPAWRAAQVRETDIEIAALRTRLFRLGVRDVSAAGGGGDQADLT